MSPEERAAWERQKSIDKENEIRLLSYMETYELCLIWDKYYKNTIYAENKRRDISKALQMSNRNPLLCRNPNQDSARRAEDKSEEEAMRRAEDAEWSKDPVLKPGKRASVPWVRIPPSAPFLYRLFRH